jgi:hypothetical protein
MMFNSQSTQLWRMKLKKKKTTWFNSPNPWSKSLNLDNLIESKSKKIWSIIFSQSNIEGWNWKNISIKKMTKKTWVNYPNLWPGL